MGLFDAIEQLAETAKTPQPDGKQSNPDFQQHAHYHRKIVVAGGCFATLGAVVGLVFLILAASGVESLMEGLGFLLITVLLGVGGFVFGAALMCMVAPKAFLTGPVGKPWMTLIGTKSVLVARIVCLLFGLAVMSPFVCLGVLILFVK